MGRTGAKRATSLETIGWREWVSLPALGIASMKAKVDTGARSSSLHALDITIDEERGNVTFDVCPDHEEPSATVRCHSPLLEVRPIKSSNGMVEERAVIRTPLRIGRSVREADLTLTSREGMGFEMLLGREAIRGTFVVDPSRSFLLGGSRYRSQKHLQSGALEEET